MTEGLLGGTGSVVGSCRHAAGLERSAERRPRRSHGADPRTTASKSTAATDQVGTGNTDPTGATAKCKDGTYSKSKHH